MSRSPLLLFGYLLALLLQTSNVAARCAEAGVEQGLCVAAPAKAAVGGAGSDPAGAGLNCETFCAICATAAAIAPLGGHFAHRFDASTLRVSDPKRIAAGRSLRFRDPNAPARAGPCARLSPIG